MGNRSNKLLSLLLALTLCADAFPLNAFTADDECSRAEIVTFLYRDVK